MDTVYRYGVARIGCDDAVGESGLTLRLVTNCPMKQTDILSGICKIEFTQFGDCPIKLCQTCRSFTPALLSLRLQTLPGGRPPSLSPPSSSSSSPPPPPPQSFRHAETVALTALSVCGNLCGGGCGLRGGGVHFAGDPPPSLLPPFLRFVIVRSTYHLLSRRSVRCRLKGIHHLTSAGSKGMVFLKQSKSHQEGFQFFGLH